MSISLNPYALMYSMKTVDKWSNTINSNINGATKNAFKSSNIFFGGGGQSVEFKPSTTLRQGIQAPENSLNVSHTVIDFKQGDVVASTIKTHLALQGDGFFVVSDSATLATGKTYYTRNGEFHVDATGKIRTQEGLYLMDVTGNAAKANTSDLESVFNLGSSDPLAPQPTPGEKLRIASISDKQSLMYSHIYGSQYFEASAYTNPINYAFDDTANLPNTTVFSSKLEASNSNMAKEVAELSMSKNLFDALTKQFLVYLNNVDTALSLIK